MNAWLSFLSGLLALGYKILERMDKAAAARFRDALRSDPGGMLVEQLGGKNSATPGVAKSSAGNPRR